MPPRFTNFPCPLCGHEHTTVVKTAEVRRRRRCLGCTKEFTTYEVYRHNNHGGARKGEAWEFEEERLKQMELPI